MRLALPSIKEMTIRVQIEVNSKGGKEPGLADYQSHSSAPDEIKSFSRQQFYLEFSPV